VPEEQVLHLHHRDVLPAANDDVLRPTGDPQVPGIIETGQIPDDVLASLPDEYRRLLDDA